MATVLIVDDSRLARDMVRSAIKSLHPEWTVAKAVQLFYRKAQQEEAARALAGVAELSVRWKAQLLED